MLYLRLLLILIVTTLPATSCDVKKEKTSEQLNKVYTEVIASWYMNKKCLIAKSSDQDSLDLLVAIMGVKMRISSSATQMELIEVIAKNIANNKRYSSCNDHTKTMILINLNRARGINNYYVGQYVSKFNDMLTKFNAVDSGIQIDDKCKFFPMGLKNAILERNKVIFDKEPFEIRELLNSVKKYHQEKVGDLNCSKLNLVKIASSTLYELKQLEQK